MKNKILKLFTIFSSITFILFGYLLTGKAEQIGSASALSFSAVSSKNNGQETLESTPFLVDPTIVAISNHVSTKNSQEAQEPLNEGSITSQTTQYIYVFDNADSSIKVIDKSTNDFRSTNAVCKIDFTPQNISLISNIILLFGDNNKISALNQSDFSEIQIDPVLKNTFEDAYKMLVVNIGGEDKILICPENPLLNNFQLITLNEINQENGIGAKSSLQFKISSKFNNFSSYDFIYACENQGNLFLMLMNDDSVLSFEYDIISAKNEITLSKAVNGFDHMSSLSDFGAISLENGTLLAMKIEHKIQLYSLEIGSTEIVLTHLPEKDITVTTDYEQDFATCENAFVLLSKNKQELQVYSFAGTIDNISFSKQTKKNPNVTTSYWFDNNKYIYVKTTSQASLYDYPYSKSEIVSTPSGSTMVIIGNGKLETTQENIVGYNYVLYTANDRNYYGYIKSEFLEELEKTTYPAQKVTVLTNTALLKFPSHVRDSVNTEIDYNSETSQIELLPATADVTVVQGESGLYLYSATGTKFLRVIVKNGDKTIEGFIDQTRARFRTEKGEKVITNATIKRDNSEIFTEDNDQSDIITLLDEGYRVKIIGKRNTKTNFTKVSFNDRAGNLHTGYVYTYNLETDTWTMLQILGVALIIINTILLVIIICVKNKVTK